MAQFCIKWTVLASVGFFSQVPPPHPTSSPSGTDGDRKFWVHPFKNLEKKPWWGHEQLSDKSITKHYPKSSRSSTSRDFQTKLLSLINIVNSLCMNPTYAARLIRPTIRYPITQSLHLCIHRTALLNHAVPTQLQMYSGVPVWVLKGNDGATSKK